jgi:hypothetical protein
MCNRECFAHMTGNEAVIGMSITDSKVHALVTEHQLAFDARMQNDSSRDSNLGIHICDATLVNDECCFCLSGMLAMRMHTRS